MSIKKKIILIGFLAYAGSAVTAAYASDPEVVALHATFITKSNTKDQDPHLDIKIYNNQKVLVAENDGVTGDWSDKGINSISLDLTKYNFKKSDLAGGKVELVVHPEATDDWAFDYNIATTYSDNSVVWQRWTDKQLTRDKPTLSDSLN
jgi:hypothetical protein